MRPRAEGINGKLDTKISTANTHQPRAYRLKIDDCEVIARIRQGRRRYSSARAQQRENIHATGYCSAGIAQIQRPSSATQGNTVTGGSDLRGLMRQDLPCNVDIISRIGNRDVTIELETLQKGTVPAQTATVEVPGWQKSRIHGHLYLEFLTAVGWHRDTSRRRDGDGAAGGIVRIAETWCDRIGASTAAVVAHNDSLLEGRRSCQRVIAK